jgi:hypothetical protein
VEITVDVVGVVVGETTGGVIALTVIVQLRPLTTRR